MERARHGVSSRVGRGGRLSQAVTPLWLQVKHTRLHETSHPSCCYPVKVFTHSCPDEFLVSLLPGPKSGHSGKAMLSGCQSNKMLPRSQVVKDSPQPHSPLELGLVKVNSALQEPARSAAAVVLRQDSVCKTRT